MPKAQIPAPIARPLAKAYLREFTGWSTAYPPGLSDPTSLRKMENVLVNKDGSVRVRPGLRFLSYGEDLNAFPLQPVGTHEAFYTAATGSKAYLFAVRELDDTVGFRVLFLGASLPVVVDLDDVFTVQSPDLNFSAATTYVKYLQIDNKIFALSNAGEPMRYFTVGEGPQIAKRLQSIERPLWDFHDKLRVIQPEKSWIDGNLASMRTNQLKNPSMEGALADTWYALTNTTINQDDSLFNDGLHSLKLQSTPQRTNLMEHPERATAVSLTGWSEYDAANATISLVSDSIQVSADCDYLGGEALVWNSGGSADVVAGESYKLAFNVTQLSASAKVIAYLEWRNVSNAVISRSFMDFGTGTGVKTTATARTAPTGAVRAHLMIGLKLTASVGSARTMRFKEIILVKLGESPTFFSGASAGAHWTGTADASTSIEHVPGPTNVRSNTFPVAEGQDVAVLTSARATEPHNVEIGVRWYDLANSVISDDYATAESVTTAWEDIDHVETAPAGAVKACLIVRTDNLDWDEAVYLDSALLEQASAVGTYFSGSTTDTLLLKYEWAGDADASISYEKTFTASAAVPDPATPYDDTLISSTATDNDYSFGFFYCFENEVGENAFSQVTVVRAKRPWQAWAWFAPKSAGDPGEPDYTSPVSDPEACADQLVAIMPEEVFNAGLSAGALNWSLYMLTWSDQNSVPVEAVKIAEVELTPTSSYADKGWARMTPQQSAYEEVATIPTETNRYNYSNPSTGGQGLVAADRMIIVKDPMASAVIRWTSNEQGEYTNFSASRGGGYKTLTSGNLQIPACVKLWQNPQSVDTLTILCDGTDSHSTGYYMAPAAITGQADTTTIMGFEETTATPGTVSPYGVEVFNNTLFHPLDDQLMKSTAANYNINHKSLTDQIENRWVDLVDKHRIVSSQLDKRLYFIVTNPYGAPLEPGANGNELWIFDAETEKSTWSKFLIQGVSLRKIEYDDQVRMSVIAPSGIYYLDDDAATDQFVADDGTVQERNIPWFFETNTQGANRAHDAWCRLQQIQLTLGNFLGELKWGIRGWDENGKPIRKEKIKNDFGTPDNTDYLPWDVDDFLQIRRNMKEWFLYAGSIADPDGTVHASQGQVSLVQYRYAPVSVNVGYEYGSIETFEYGRAIVNPDDSNTNSGVPVPVLDQRRP